MWRHWVIILVSFIALWGHANASIIARQGVFAYDVSETGCSALFEGVHIVDFAKYPNGTLTISYCDHFVGSQHPSHFLDEMHFCTWSKSAMKRRNEWLIEKFGFGWERLERNAACNSDVMGWRLAPILILNEIAVS